MLAQNFKTAANLGITEIEVEALIKVLGMLERDEVRHIRVVTKHISSLKRHDPVGFNMHKFYAESECGTVCCICGWAESIGNLEPGSLMLKRLHRPALDRLFDPTGITDANAITPTQAAIALRSYLTTGDANWAEALAC